MPWVLAWYSIKEVKDQARKGSALRGHPCLSPQDCRTWAYISRRQHFGYATMKHIIWICMRRHQNIIAHRVCWGTSRLYNDVCRRVCDRLCTDRSVLKIEGRKEVAAGFERHDMILLGWSKKGCLSVFMLFVTSPEERFRSIASATRFEVWTLSINLPVHNTRLVLISSF